MRILVTGGAGYIGSHTAAELLHQGHEVVVLDNLEAGSAPGLGCPLVQTDLRDRSAVFDVLTSQAFDGVVHFAAYIAAGESVEQPGRYFQNNLVGSANLLDAMVAAGVRLFVFSSSCAVYGQPRRLPVRESDPIRPENPYGESKHLVERMLPWYERAHGLRFVALRYFNAAGAALDGSLGDASRPVTRLIPVAMQAALGQRDGLTIFGNDYPTPDGTCIRDYVHVVDLAVAHARALEYLASGGASDRFNVGAGRGYSNLEVVETVRRITGCDFPVRFGPRRPGDLVVIYADTTRIRRVLGWQPAWSDLETIVRTDWAWRRAHSTG